MAWFVAKSDLAHTGSWWMSGAQFEIVEETVFDQFRAHVEAHRPAILRGVGVRDLPDFALNRLRARYGDVSVPLELSLDKIYAPNPAINSGRYTRYEMTFERAARLMERQRFEPFGCYISNFSARALDGAVLCQLPDIFDTLGDGEPDHIFFVGGDGSGTHWHYDPTNNFLIVLDGCKQVSICPFEAITPHEIDSGCANFARDRDPDVTGAHMTTLGPDDCLFLPAGYWHRVENQGSNVAITVSYPRPAKQNYTHAMRRLEEAKARAKSPPAATVTARALSSLAPRTSPFRTLSQKDPQTMTTFDHVTGDTPILQVLDQTLSVSDLFNNARGLKQLGFVDAVARYHLVQKVAEDRKVVVTDDDLQTAADHFRASNGLYSSDETHRWLARHMMTLDDLEVYLEAQLLEEKLSISFTQAEVRKMFEGMREEFDSVIMRSIIVGQEPLAVELKAMIDEGAESFEVLAGRYCNQRHDQLAQGRLSVHHRRDLSKDVADILFAAHPGTVFDPSLGAQGWMVQRLEEICPAALDVGTDAALRVLLLDVLVRREGYYWHSEFVGEIEEG